MNCKVALDATNWWINLIKERCKELYPDKLIHDGSNLVVIDISLEQELYRFQKLLFNQILYHLEYGLYLSLTCCYWPSGELGALARKASISKDYFPVRAHMQIYKKHVEVSLNGEDLHKLHLSTN